MMSSHRHLLHQLDFNATINPYIYQLSGAKLTSAHKDRNNKINMCWSSDSDCQCTRLCFFQGGGGSVETLTYFHHNGWWGEAVCVCVCVCALAWRVHYLRELGLRGGSNMLSSWLYARDTLPRELGLLCGFNLIQLISSNYKISLRIQVLVLLVLHAWTCTKNTFTYLDIYLTYSRFHSIPGNSNIAWCHRLLLSACLTRAICCVHKYIIR